MERGSLGFGSGKRVCLGRHIAEMEVKKIVPALLHTFDIVLEDESASLKTADLANFSGGDHGEIRREKPEQGLREERDMIE